MRPPREQPTWRIAARAAGVAVVFFGVWFVLALGARRLDRAFGVLLPAWIVPWGIAVMALGGALSLTCIALFVVCGRGTPAPFDPPSAFVASGPYRFCRNPMLLGFFTLVAGLGLTWRSPAVLGMAALILAAGHVLVVTWEEPRLRRRFGDSYLAYCRSTPRWIPKL